MKIVPASCGSTAMALTATGLGPMLVHAPSFCWAISRSGARNIPIIMVVARMELPCRHKWEEHKFLSVVKPFDAVAQYAEQEVVSRAGAHKRGSGVMARLEMPLSESDAQVVRHELERILASPGFARNQRLSGFLRYVVEGHLEGKDHELKESVIAVEVFGRNPDFDSRLDPVVRTEAVRLRARLSDYYLKEGKADALVIELPKGG